MGARDGCFLVIRASCCWRLPESRIQVSFTFFLTFPNPQPIRVAGEDRENTLISPFLVVVVVHWQFDHVQEKMFVTFVTSSIWCFSARFDILSRYSCFLSLRPHWRKMKPPSPFSFSKLKGSIDLKMFVALAGMTGSRFSSCNATTSGMQLNHFKYYNNICWVTWLIFADGL